MKGIQLPVRKRSEQQDGRSDIKIMPIYEYICKDCNHKFEEIGDGISVSTTVSGGCAGCSGGNCAHCHS